MAILDTTLTSINDTLNLFGIDAEAANQKANESNTSFRNLVDTVLWAADGIWRGLQFIIAQVNLFHTFLQGILGIIRALFTFNFWEILKALITFGENLRTAAYDLLKALVGIFADTSNWPDLKPMGKSMVDGLVAG